MSLRPAFARDPVTHSLGIVGALMIAQRVVTVARGIVFARALGAEQVGLFTLSFFVLGLGIPIVTFGLPSSYGRYVPRYEDNRSLRAFMRVTTLATAVLTVVFVALALVFARPLAAVLLGDADRAGILRITALTLLPAVFHRNLSSFFKGLRAFRLSAWIEFAYLVLFSVASIVVVLWIEPSISAVLWTHLAAFLLPVLVFGFITWRYLASLPDQSPRVQEERFARRMFAFCVWFVIIPSGITLFDYVDRLMLNHFLDTAVVGVYSQAFNTASFLLSIGYVPNLVLGPTLSAAWERHDRAGVQHTFNLTLKLMLLVLLGASFALVLVKRPLLVLLYGQEFAGGAAVLPALLVFQCFEVMYSIAGMYSGLIERTYLPAFAVGAGLVLNVALNLFLIPRFGMKGAAYAAMISYAVINAVLYALNRRTGLVLERRTMAVCVLPFALLLPLPLLVAAATATLAVVLGTNLLLTREEKVETLRSARRLLRLPLALLGRGAVAT